MPILARLAQLEADASVEIVTCRRLQVAAQTPVAIEIDGELMAPSRSLVVEAGGPRATFLVPHAYATRPRSPAA